MIVKYAKVSGFIGVGLASILAGPAGAATPASSNNLPPGSGLVTEQVSVGIFQLASGGAKTLVYQTASEIVANNVPQPMPGISNSRGDRIAITATPSINQVNQVNTNIDFTWQGAGSWFTKEKQHTVHANITVPVSESKTVKIRSAGRTFEVEVKAIKA